MLMLTMLKSGIIIGIISAGTTFGEADMLIYFNPFITGGGAPILEKLLNEFFNNIFVNP